MLSVLMGATVTIIGPIGAGLTQVFSGSGTITGFSLVPTLYPQWWGANGSDSTDDTVAFKNAIAATPSGGTFYIPIGNYKLTDELTITRPIKIMGSMAEDSGQTYLSFNLDAQASSRVGIRINNQVHGCILQDFYMSNDGVSTTHDGILLDGVEGDYPNYIWYSKLNGVYARNFSNNFRLNNILVTSVINCRSILANSGGFVQGGFLCTGLSFYNCYSHDCTAGPGFQFQNAYYSGLKSCYSDGNLRGFFFQDSYGGYVTDCGSESSGVRERLRVQFKVRMPLGT